MHPQTSNSQAGHAAPLGLQGWVGGERVDQINGGSQLGIPINLSTIETEREGRWMQRQYRPCLPATLTSNNSHISHSQP